MNALLYAKKYHKKVLFQKIRIVFSEINSKNLHYKSLAFYCIALEIHSP